MPDFTALEPISTGDIIDRAVRLYRRNFTSLIGIASIPSICYCIGSLIFWAGYSRLLLGTVSGSPIETMLMIGAGGIIDLLAGLLLLATIAGMSRCVGDQVMLGEPITLGKCAKVVRRRIGDILLMALLFVVFGMVMYFVLTFVILALIMIVAFAFGIITTLGMPTWLSSTIGAFVILGGLALGVIVALIVVSRVIFLPPVMMIEGQSAGESVGRAFRLGGKNWYRLGALLLFAYFVKLSMTAAIGIPLVGWLGVNGSLTAEMLAQPWWTAVFTAINQLSEMLIMPILMISITLLYFDNRVRKEGYDLELLTIGLQSAPSQFQWKPAPSPVFTPYTVLGLNQPYAAGVAVPASPVPAHTAPAPGSWPPSILPGRGATSIGPLSPTQIYRPTMAPMGPITSPVGLPITGADSQPANVPLCPQCKAPIEPAYKFCQMCGFPVGRPAANVTAEQPTQRLTGSVGSKEQSQTGFEVRHGTGAAIPETIVERIGQEGDSTAASNAQVQSGPMAAPPDGSGSSSEAQPASEGVDGPVAEISGGQH